MSVTVDPIIQKIAYVVIVVGLGNLVKGQKAIQKEAKEGRTKIHVRIDEVIKDLGMRVGKVETKMSIIETLHNMNHPKQLSKKES